MKRICLSFLAATVVFAAVSCGGGSKKAKFHTLNADGTWSETTIEIVDGALEEGGVIPTVASVTLTEAVSASGIDFTTGQTLMRDGEAWYGSKACTEDDEQFDSAEPKEGDWYPKYMVPAITLTIKKGMTLAEFTAPANGWTEKKLVVDDGTPSDYDGPVFVEGGKKYKVTGKFGGAIIESAVVTAAEKEEDAPYSTIHIDEAVFEQGANTKVWVIVLPKFKITSGDHTDFRFSPDKKYWGLKAGTLDASKEIVAGVLGDYKGYEDNALTFTFLEDDSCPDVNEEHNAFSVYVAEDGAAPSSLWHDDSITNYNE